MSVCKNVVLAGVRCAGGGRISWRECVKDDMDVLGLRPELAIFRDEWRGLNSGKTSTHNIQHRSIAGKNIATNTATSTNDIQRGKIQKRWKEQVEFPAKIFSTKMAL